MFYNNNNISSFSLSLFLNNKEQLNLISYFQLSHVHHQAACLFLITSLLLIRKSSSPSYKTLISKFTHTWIHHRCQYSPINSSDNVFKQRVETPFYSFTSKFQTKNIQFKSCISKVMSRFHANFPFINLITGDVIYDY